MRYVLALGLAAAALTLQLAESSARRVLARATEAPLEAPSPKTGSVAGVVRSLARLKTRGETSERDLVVHLAPQSGTQVPAAPSEALVVKQVKLQFDPHVLPVQAGTKVAFTNDDSVTHNVFSQEECCKVDRDMAANERAEVAFPKAGVVPIVCRLHPDMSLWVIVLDHPWFTRTEFAKVEGEGEKAYEARFRIDGVPPGTYTLTTWNKKLAAVTQTVTVTADAVMEVALTLDK